MYLSRGGLGFISVPSMALFIAFGLAVQGNFVSAAVVTGVPQERHAGFFPAGGEVAVAVTLDDMSAGPGNILVTVEVLPSPNGVVGDIRAVFFHISDESLLASPSSFSVVGADVDNAKARYQANAVTRMVGDNTNINPYGSFDLGFEIGVAGAGIQGDNGDDIQSTSFVLSNSNVPLDVSLFEFQEFGVRLANVGPASDIRLRRDSTQRDAKQTGTLSASMATPVPEPSTAFACALGAMFSCCGAGLRRTRKRTPN